MSAVAAAATLVILVAGCASPAEEPPPAPAYVSNYQAPAAMALAPLRGTTVGTDAVAYPSIAVKIDNQENARPQIALNRTDIVFEERVEGGMTRYVAIWQSDIPDEVGPVRSIRPMDPDIISPFGGIVAYSGGQEQFVAMMQATGLVNEVFDYDDTGLFFRAGERPSPHDVILNAATAVDRRLELAAPAAQFAWAADVGSSTAGREGVSASKIGLQFSNSSHREWTWDGESGLFLRDQDGEPDLGSEGERIGAVNVVTMRVGIDWTYGEVPKTVMIGSGEAWVAAGGKSVHATWSKDSATAPIRLVDDHGVTVRLAPGNTWIELVPNEDGSVEIQP